MWKFLFYISMILVDNSGTAEECAGCDEDKLVSYLANLEVLSPESIFSLSIDDIDLLCKKLEENLKPMDQYLKSCRNPDEKDLYISLIRGVKVLNDKLCCTDTDFYKRFSIFHPCLAELKNDFESCNGPADWNEEQDERVCRTYKSIVDCYYIKAAKVCGKEAAKAITELIEDVINSIINAKCTGIKSLPVVRDAMPEKYIRRNSAEKECLNTWKTITIVLLHISYIVHCYILK
ncbi:uncharacterized protein isoform X1 [Leptinotarsa decemlineata]|uniref:uncharacterized protein isoform X1 n=1 Tax=Leptinotarsa decemlineata TaxID=7539 RepID=UPI003D30A42C